VASTLATLVADVKARLNTSAAATYPAYPDDTTITGWLRSAFKWAVGVCPPIQSTTVTVSGTPDDDGNWVIALTADVVYYVSVNHKLLLPVEWGKRGDNITILSAAAPYGATVQVWYYEPPALTSGVTEVETTCIFGPDWLEELAVMYAAGEVCRRLMTTAPSNDREGWANLWRTYQADREAMLQQLVGIRGAFISEKENALAMRANLGDGVPRQGAYTGLVNRSRIINKNTGSYG